MIDIFINEIKENSDNKRAFHHSKFFKTDKGQYGEGDKFYGLTVPQIRSISKKYVKELTLEELDKTIKNPYHEVRCASLFVLVLKYSKAKPAEKKEIFELYLNNIQYINNWDLIDLSAPHILGDFTFNYGTKDALFKLSKRNHLWSQRAAILASFYFIRQYDFDLTLEFCKSFLSHKHDLIHKACGWMLREAGKRNPDVLYSFLDENAQYMPRTMLRYSIEKLDEEKRKNYMKIKKCS